MPCLTASNATLAGSPPSGPAHGRHADPLTPGLQLVRGRGPEGVRRAEHDVLVLGHQYPGQLADRGRLAGAVHPDHQDRPPAGLVAVGGQRPVQRRVDQRDQLLAQDARACGVGDALDADPLRSASTSSVVGPPPGRGDQRGLEVLPGLLVDPVPADQHQQAPAQRAVGPGQPPSEPDQPAVGALGPLVHQRRDGRLDLDGLAPRAFEQPDGRPTLVPARPRARGAAGQLPGPLAPAQGGAPGAGDQADDDHDGEEDAADDVPDGCRVHRHIVGGRDGALGHEPGADRPHREPGLATLGPCRTSCAAAGC